MFCFSSYSQLLLNEDFDYKTGKLTLSGYDNVSNGQWGMSLSSQGGSMALNVVSGNLIYNKYYSATNSNKFKYVNPFYSDYDAAERYFAPQYNGIVYCSFLLKVNSLDTLVFNGNDEYILAILNSAITIKRTLFDNSIFNIGITNNKSLDNSRNYVKKNLSIDSTYLIVFAHVFGKGNIDSNYLWVNPIDFYNTPSPDFRLPLDFNVNSPFIHNEIIIGNSGITRYELDAIHVGKTWKDIMGVGMPSYAISEINTTRNETGDAEWMGVRAKLHGIVYGNNQSKRGLKMLLRDATGGISIIDTLRNYTAIPNEGDSIEVKGTVFSDRGLVSFAIDTLIILSSNNMLKQATLVSKIYENTENDLARLNKIKFIVKPSDSTWRVGSYRTIETVTLDTNFIFINENSSMIGKPLPKNSIFTVIGIAGQQSSSLITPFLNDGYYLSPRYASDIIEGDSILPFNLLTPSKNKIINIAGNQNDQLSFNWQKAKSNMLGKDPVYTIEIDTFSGDFTKPLVHLVSQNMGNDTSISMSLGAISNSLNLKEGQIFIGKWRVLANIQSNQIHSDSTFKISFVRGKLNAIEELPHKTDVRLFPNPAIESITLQITETEAEYTIYSSMGMFVSAGSMASSADISLLNMASGMYIIQLKSPQGSYIGNVKFLKN